MGTKQEVKVRKTGEEEAEILIKKDREARAKEWDDALREEEEEVDEETDEEFDYSPFKLMFGFIILIIGLFSLGNYYHVFESGSQRIVRIQHEISEAQQDNIAIAEGELTTLYIKRERIMDSVRIVLGDIELYKQCINLNKFGQLPVDCNSITLSLKQKLGWKVNSKGNSQEYKQLHNEGVFGRTQELLNMYSTTRGTIDIWESLEKKYGIKMQVAIAIAKADSSLGDELKSANNIGNVGNNDRGNTQHYKDIEQGIEAIFKTLNNKYLGDIYTVGYLSQGGRTIVDAPACSVSGEYCYATSEENWNINVINTLRLLYNDPTIDESFVIRTSDVSYNLK